MRALLVGFGLTAHSSKRLTRMNNTHFLLDFVSKKTLEPHKEEFRQKLISFHDILILKGGSKLSLAQFLNKLEALNLSMALRLFLSFWRFGAS